MKVGVVARAFCVSLCLAAGLVALPAHAAPALSHHLWIIGDRGGEAVLVVGKNGLTLDPNYITVEGPVGFGALYIRKIGTGPEPDIAILFALPWDAVGSALPIESGAYHRHLSAGRYLVGYLGQPSRRISIAASAAKDIVVEVRSPATHARFLTTQTLDPAKLTLTSTFATTRPTYVMTMAIARGKPFVADANALCFRSSSGDCWTQGHDSDVYFGENLAGSGHISQTEGLVAAKATSTTIEMDDALIGVPVDRTLVTLLLE